MQLYDVSEYRASKNWPYAISAGCVVYRESPRGIEVLLLGREPAHTHNTTKQRAFNIPKGHVSQDETLQQSAVRETEEEAGVTAEIKTYLGALQRHFLHPVHKVKNEKTIHYFAAEWQKDLPVMDSEHDDKVWVLLNEAEKLLGPPNPKDEDEIIRRLKHFLELTDAS